MRERTKTVVLVCILAAEVACLLYFRHQYMVFVNSF